MRRVAGWALRLAAAGSLAVDAYVHADLVSRYAPNRSGGLSQGDLFEIEAAVAALAALLILVSGRGLIWAFVFVVAGSALAAVLVYANYDPGSIGPVPDMYEPLWYPKKTLAAVFEAVAAGAALLGFVTASSRRAEVSGERGGVVAG